MNVQNPAASRGIAIQAVDLVKNYGAGSNMVHALRGVNVSFERGKFTAIMGPSGSGKSTLMRLHLPKLQPVAHVHRRTEHPHAADFGR